MFPGTFFYILIVALGACLLLSTIRAANFQWSIADGLSLSCCVLLTGMLFSRFTYWATAPNYTGSLFDVINIANGGLVSWGGIFGGILGSTIWAKLAGCRPMRCLDLITPAFFIALGIGRVGCLMEGDDHGSIIFSAFEDETTNGLVLDDIYDTQGYLKSSARKILDPAKAKFPWFSVAFGRNTSVQSDLIDLPLYPTQPMMIIYNFLIGSLIWLWEQKSKKKETGYIFLASLALWSICRFTVEYFRGDVSRGIDIVWNLSSGQIFALFSATIAVSTYFFSQKQLERDKADQFFVQSRKSSVHVDQ